MMFALVACSSEDGGGEGDESTERSAKPPRYVIATAVSDDDTSTTYVATVPGLDGQELSLAKAREFGGWSDMKVLGPWVFVSSGESPTVERFTVNGRGELEAAGRIGFGDYGDYADMSSQILISPTKAYFVAENEYVIWNPTKLEITGSIPLPALPTREAIEPFVATDRGLVIRDGKLYQTVNWTDTDEFKMLDDSKVIVVDLEEDEVVGVLDAPCPDLSVASQDDDGNIYFSNWVYAPGATLIHGAVNACVLKLPSGSDSFDEAWTVTFADVTGGHEGANLVHAGGGTALFALFREDAQKHEADTDTFDWLFEGESWEFGSLNLETREHTPLPALGKHSGGYYAYRLGGKVVLLAPDSDYASTTFLELDDDKNPREVLTTKGWSTRIYALDVD